jgi:hypothetical protein
MLNTVKENIFLLMDSRSTKASGTMERGMEKAYILRTAIK